MIANLLSGKYHINTMEFIKLFRVNTFMLVIKFPCLTIFLFHKRRQIFDQFMGLFKETSGKNGESCVDK